MNTMNQLHGELIAPNTLQLSRSLPGPIERVWAFLTESDKRGQWLASGDIDPRVDGEVTLSFHHASLSKTPGEIPEKYRSMENGFTMHGHVILWDPPHHLAYTWNEKPGKDPSQVRFDLSEENDGRVLLTITHSRLPDRESLVSVAGGWHTHVGLLIDRLEGREPDNFWQVHQRLQADYDTRLPA